MRDRDFRCTCTTRRPSPPTSPCHRRLTPRADTASDSERCASPHKVVPHNTCTECDAERHDRHISPSRMVDVGHDHRRARDIPASRPLPATVTGAMGGPIGQKRGSTDRACRDWQAPTRISDPHRSRGEPSQRRLRMGGEHRPRSHETVSSHMQSCCGSSAQMRVTQSSIITQERRT